MYGTKPRYNDVRYNDIPDITMSFWRTERKIFPDITISQYQHTAQFKQNIEQYRGLLTMIMAGSSHTKIREGQMGCPPAGDCRGLCVVHRPCCIAGRLRLQVVRPDFETAPGLSGVVFFPSLRRSSGFQTLGLPSGLLTATFVDRMHRPARKWVEFLPRRVASLVGLCTGFSEHHGFGSQP